MKAMILCAGQGTRLRPLTYAVPKPMVPLVDRPVLQYIVEHLRDQGVDDLAINLSYLPEAIQNYFRDGSAYGVDVTYSYEGRLVDGEFKGAAIGSAGGLRKVQDELDFFDDTFLVLCGDAVIDLDIRAAVRQHKERRALATIVLADVPQHAVSKYGIVDMASDGRISAFQEKPEIAEAVSTLANTGIYIFEPEIFDHIPTGQTMDLGGDLFPKLTEGGHAIYGGVAPLTWLDIGTLQDYAAASFRLLTDRSAGIDIPGRVVDDRLRTGPHVTMDRKAVTLEGPIYLGGGTVIEAGARIIGPAVIGQNCRISANAVVHQSVLGDHVHARSGAMISNAVISGGYFINEAGEFIHLRKSGPVGDVREPAGSGADDMASDVVGSADGDSAVIRRPRQASGH